jgi:hypothetical protein
MRTALAALAIAVFTIIPDTALAQERPVQLEALPQASRDVLNAWLQRDCSVGASQEELTQLRTLAGIAQEALAEAYRQGPPPELERLYQSAFSDAFDAREVALAREGTRLFGTEDAASLLAVDRETYVSRRLNAARINYRTNAVLGLGVVRARDALPLLNQIAADVHNPMREAAGSSIEALKE